MGTLFSIRSNCPLDDKSVFKNRPCFHGRLAKWYRVWLRLGNQEIAGSTPAVVIAFLSEILLFILATNDFKPPKISNHNKNKGIKNEILSYVMKVCRLDRMQNE